MGKKKNAKKGGGEDFFDEFGESVPANNGTAPASDDEAPVAPRKNAFAAMSLDDDSNDNTDEKGEAGNASKAQDDDDDQFGGLMSAIKKSNTSSSKKDKKKKKKQQDDDIWDELGEDVSGNAKAPENDKVDAMDVDANQDVSTPAKDEDDGGKDSKQIDKAAPEADAEEDDADDGAPRIMTKKEKERLKKEKEKAKKKAQAAAKKAADGGASTQTPAPPAEESSKTDVKTAENDAEDSGGEEEGATAADKKKKKKKKGAQSKPEPAAAPSGKKPSAAIQALQARMAAQRKAEEEARLAEEEARQREEEAERLEKEEAERKEADRLRRKEKEKAKREQLKREGKLLTPKQKAEKAAAEARMQAMIKTGQIKVDALANRENRDESEEKERPRKVIDSRKKKGKGPSGPPSKLSAALPEQPKVEETEITEPTKEANLAPSEPVSAEPEAPSKDEAAAEDEDVKDSWDVASDEDVKDEWDAESDEDEKPKEKTEKAAAVSGQTNGKPASAAKADGKTSSSKAPSAAPARASAKGKNADSSSEEDDDSDDDDEDDDDDSDSDDSDDDDDDELTTAQRMAAQRRAEAEQRKKEKHEAALAARSKDNLRSPICCIMGHVDTGKTKLLDKVRQTNVQEGEAGGITQQIGATYFPVDVLKQKIAPIDPDNKQAYNAPGLLILDTPGHASFTNMRTRGSSLCNIAILVVDIMHGLEPQTLESIRLLRDRKTPFVVALNKIDRLYGWQSSPDSAFRNTLAKQNRATQNEFQDRVDKTIVAFAEQGLNAVLYYDNKNFARNVSLVPTSAHTGEGIPDMLQLIVNLTQERMSEKLMYLSELECSVLEVKTEEGLGTTIDVILSNGVMNEGERIVLCGMNGPIVTQVRALLTPQPLKEMRIKGKYVHNKQVKAALGVKIVAPDLEKAISGSRLMVIGEDDDEEDLKEEVMSDLTGLLHSIDKSGRGVCVQASTIGSLEALLDFLKESKIPVNGINIGPVYKRDVMRCATMLEKAPDLAVMLCFDVTIDKDAERLAEELGVTIFSARIIYHLFDNFTAHQKRVLENKQKEKADVAVWPCRLKILAVFAKRSPLILGCEIVSGDLRLGTPIGVKNKETGELVNLGRVTSLEVNHKRLDVVTARTAGAGVAVRIECAAHETPKSYGRHFTDSDELFSLITRQSIDTLKNLFWDNVNIEQKKTIKYLKGVLGIP